MIYSIKDTVWKWLRNLVVLYEIASVVPPSQRLNYMREGGERLKRKSKY